MTARIYVGTYAKYNAGNLTGAWLDLEDYSDAEEFNAAALALHKDEADPELMFQDFEGFPRAFYGESHVSDDLWAWLELNEHERELLEVYQDRVCDTGTIGQAREAFMGKGSDRAAIAEQFHEEAGDLDNVPDWLQGHIDWDSVARDMEYGAVAFADVGRECWAFRTDC